MRRSDPRERFWDKVCKAPGHGPGGDCWVWTSWKKTGGYGLIRDGARRLAAHRLSYEMAYGPIPEGDGYHGTCVCHSCDNPSCVRPAHLFLGSMRDNIRDKHKKGRAADFKGVRNGQHKLTEREIREIRASRGPNRVIARRFGISESWVWRIRALEAWTHVV